MEQKVRPAVLTRRIFLHRAAAASVVGAAVGEARAESLPDQQAKREGAKGALPLTNDTARLSPRTVVDVPSLEFDFPGLEIGVAAYEEGPTGCTVFRFLRDPMSVVDVRGGMPGMVSGSSAEDLRTAAICFAGGSLHGLEAASGVSAELFAQSKYQDLALVRGAILWDLWRENKIYPDKALGRAALKTARPGFFPLGRAGAGVSAGCAGEDTGQGGAFRQVGPTKIAVFTVVNAAGVIVDRMGRVVRGNRDPKTGKRRHPRELLEQRLKQGEPAGPIGEGKNTTLTLVVTNQKFSGYFDTRWQLGQLARQVHGSMARCIQPFHSMSDGDVLFAVTTGEVENDRLNLTDLGLLASELAWDAVLSCFTQKQG